MKAGLITLILLVLAVSLSGCGQKGPLYRELPDQKSPETKIETETETEAEADRDTHGSF